VYKRKEKQKRKNFLSARLAPCFWESTQNFHKNSCGKPAEHIMFRRFSPVFPLLHNCNNKIVKPIDFFQRRLYNTGQRGFPAARNHFGKGGTGGGNEGLRACGRTAVRSKGGAEV
jgi:hypothetical protein